MEVEKSPESVRLQETYVQSILGESNGHCHWNCYYYYWQLLLSSNSTINQHWKTDLLNYHNLYKKFIAKKNAHTFLIIYIGFSPNLSICSKVFHCTFLSTIFNGFFPLTLLVWKENSFPMNFQYTQNKIQIHYHCLQIPLLPGSYWYFQQHYVPLNSSFSLIKPQQNSFCSTDMPST